MPISVTSWGSHRKNEGAGRHTEIEVQKRKEGENYKERYMSGVADKNQGQISFTCPWFQWTLLYI